MIETPLVSVVIPAYNARETLAASLCSACAQTYRNIEIIVVDDGSQDGTLALVSALARDDPRIRVLSIENSGVAVARNTGVAAANGQFVAPLDADDLWHPCKIERQVDQIETSDRIGYVYTLYRLIDVDGRVGPTYAEHVVDGDAFATSIIINFVGNGSSPLIRRSAFEQAGGYSPSLHSAGAQGCEDYLLQALIARHWEVRCVPEYLTGYRRSPGNMSSNKERMIRSRFLAFERIVRQLPDTPRFALVIAEARQRVWLAVMRFRALRIPEGIAELRRVVGLGAPASVAMVMSMACQIAWQRVSTTLRRFGRTTMNGSPFLALDPRAEVWPAGNRLLLGGIAATRLEQASAVSIRIARPVAGNDARGPAAIENSGFVSAIAPDAPAAERRPGA